jgi:hypothetical protein
MYGFIYGKGASVGSWVPNWWCVCACPGPDPVDRPRGLSLWSHSVSGFLSRVALFESYQTDQLRDSYHGMERTRTISMAQYPRLGTVNSKHTLLDGDGVQHHVSLSLEWTGHRYLACKFATTSSRSFSTIMYVWFSVCESGGWGCAWTRMSQRHSVTYNTIHAPWLLSFFFPHSL